MKKKQKRLGKKCPECEDSHLYSVYESETLGGAEYLEEYIKCKSCGYSMRVKNKRSKLQKE